MSNKESKPEPGEFTKKAQALRRKGATNEQWEFATMLGEACERIDSLTAENKDLKKSLEPHDLIKHLQKRIDVIKANRNELFDKNVKLEAELKAKDTAITYLLEASAPMTPQQEECWPVLRQALKEKP